PADLLHQAPPGDPLPAPERADQSARLPPHREDAAGVRDQLHEVGRAAAGPRDLAGTHRHDGAGPDAEHRRDHRPGARVAQARSRGETKHPALGTPAEEAGDAEHNTYPRDGSKRTVPYTSPQAWARVG